MVAKPSFQKPAEVEASDSASPGVNGSANSQEIPCENFSLQCRVEALLFAADRPLSDARIAELLGIAGKSKITSAIRDAVDALNEVYKAGGCAFKIEQVAGGRQVLTLPAFAPIVARLRGEKQQTRLTQPAIETLAIVAYRQPIQRVEIESIRGVACGEVLRGLLERRLVRIVGRAEELGRPMLYGTTTEFLKVFGLSSLADLPQSKELRV